MTDELIVRVQGSEPEPYIVRFIRDGAAFKASCTCKAGQVGQLCKHRRDLLEGRMEAAVQPDADAASCILKMFAGSRAKMAHEELRDAEQRLEAAQLEVKKRKKAFERTLSE